MRQGTVDLILQHSNLLQTLTCCHSEGEVLFNAHQSCSALTHAVRGHHSQGAPQSGGTIDGGSVLLVA